MSRKKHRIERFIAPDAVYGDVLISKFINCLMLDGKKSVAEKIVYNALEKLKAEAEKYEKTVVMLFHEVVTKLKPSFRLKAKRVGGATYRVPAAIQDYAAVAASLKLIVTAVRSKSGKPAGDILYSELKNVLNGEGDAVKKKNEFDKAIESSKAFANFA